MSELMDRMESVLFNAILLICSSPMSLLCFPFSLKLLADIGDDEAWQTLKIVTWTVTASDTGAGMMSELAIAAAMFSAFICEFCCGSERDEVEAREDMDDSGEDKELDWSDGDETLDDPELALVVSCVMWLMVVVSIFRAFSFLGVGSSST